MKRYKPWGDFRYNPERAHRAIISEQAKEYGAMNGFRTGDVVLDIGACFGATTAFALHEANAERVMAVEPGPENAWLLWENFGDDDRVKIIDGGVVPNDWEEDTVDLWLPRDDRLTYCCSTVKKAYHKDKKTQSIVTRAVEIDWLLKQDEFTVVKVDAEGAEHEIFANEAGPVDIPDSVERVLMEVHIGRKAWKQNTGPLILSRLSNQGFRFLPDSPKEWPSEGWRNWAVVMGWERA